MPLRLRLALFGAGVVALALAVFGLLLYSLLARGVVSNQDDALRARAREAASALHGLPPSQSPVAPANLNKSDDLYVELLASDGSVLYTTATLDGRPPAAPPALLDDATRHNGAFATQGSLRMYAFPYAGGYIVAGQSTRVPQANLSGVVVFLILSAVPALVAALIASWLVAGRALAPLQAVAVAAEDIGRQCDFARRLPVPRSRHEVAALASSFNGMLNRLQEAYESQKQFVSDASHELRTPLTTIQGNAGLLAAKRVSDEVRQAAAADVVQESGRMARLVERLLTLARADSGRRLARAPVELKPLVEEVGRQAAALHPRQKLNVAAGPAALDGDEDAIRQLVWILLDNAFRYAASTVELRLSTASGWARVTVADDGPGVPARDRERIFERFYRVEQSREGSHAGLGLSIARWIAEQHGGRIVAGDATIGGAAFLVDLPLLRPS